MGYVIAVAVISMLSLVNTLSSAETNTYKVEGTVSENMDVSAISCMGSKNCLFISDEENGFQIATLSENIFSVVSPVVSLGTFKKENDIEAMTNDGRYYYLLGSHGLSKKKGKYQPSRYHLFKIQINGQGKITYQSEINIEEIILKTKLKRFYKKLLGENGVNIEGLGFHQNNLYIGFRSPVINGKAQILKVNLTRQSRFELMSVDLGKNRGVRSLEFRKNKLYILAGQSFKDGDVSSSLYEFNSVNNLEKKREINIPYDNLKAEGFDFLTDNKLIIVYDSEEDGLPLSLEL